MFITFKITYFVILNNLIIHLVRLPVSVSQTSKTLMSVEFVNKLLLLDEFWLIIYNKNKCIMTYSL